MTQQPHHLWSFEPGSLSAPIYLASSYHHLLSSCIAAVCLHFISYCPGCSSLSSFHQLLSSCCKGAAVCLHIISYCPAVARVQQSVFASSSSHSNWKLALAFRCCCKGGNTFLSLHINLLQLTYQLFLSFNQSFLISFQVECLIQNPAILQIRHAEVHPEGEQNEGETPALLAAL